jgi:RNA recognition motif-containing protein
MDKYFLSLEVLVVVGMYSLAWFIVGVKLGQHTDTKKGRKPAGKRRGGSDRNRGERGRNTGDVELYVGNLSYDVSEKDLKQSFSEFGKVSSIRLIKNKFNDKSKGYGFIEMPDRNEAEMAIRRMNNKDVQGRRIIVNEAKTRER